MSWVLNTVIYHLYKRRGGLGLKHLNGHKFKFKKNILYRNIFNNIVYKDRVYECSRCRINLVIYRSNIDNKLNIVVSEDSSLVFTGVTGVSCNQIIMKRACL